MYEFEANLVCIGNQPGLHDQTLTHQNNDNNNNNNEKDYFLEAEFQYVSQIRMYLYQYVALDLEVFPPQPPLFWE